MSLSESRLPQTSAASGLEPTQVRKIRKLAAKLETQSCYSPVPVSWFQVFSIAPVPPASDGPVDSLKQPGQFPGGYGQAFGSQAERTVDQADIPQETLQSGEGSNAFCPLLYTSLFLVWLKCRHSLTSLTSSVQLLVDSRPRTRSWLQLEVLRIRRPALDSRASLFTTAGPCPGAAPETPAA